MKENIPATSNSELTKNLITGAIAGSMAGAAFGYIMGILWFGIIAGILFGLAIGYRLHRAPIKMHYPMAMIRRILLAAGSCVLVGMGYAVLLDRAGPARAQSWPPCCQSRPGLILCSL